MANQFARRMRKDMTAAEVRLWARLRCGRAEGQHFRRQSPIGSFIADFEHRKAKVVIELDGGQHREAASYDEERTKWLEHRGYVVLRFWNSDVLRDTDAVVHLIMLTVDNRLREQEISPLSP